MFELSNRNARLFLPWIPLCSNNKMRCCKLCVHYPSIKYKLVKCTPLIFFSTHLCMIDFQLPQKHTAVYIW